MTDVQNLCQTMSRERYDELSLLLGADPTNFCDPEAALDIQLEVESLMRVQREDGRTNENLARACQIDIEENLRLLHAIS